MNRPPRGGIHRVSWVRRGFTALSAILFAGLCLAQVAAAVGVIAEREVTLRFGSAFKFRTRPVDPYDAFRGRYLDISLLQEKVPVEPRLTPAEGQTVYAVLVEERDGFARLARLVADRPRCVPFLRLRMTRPYNPRPDIAADAGIPLSTFALPFGRYYLNEGIAPAAESAYREHAEDEDSYLVVRVRGGSAVAEELYVGGRRIEEVAGR